MDLTDFGIEHIFDEMLLERNACKSKEESDLLMSRWRHRYEPFVYDILKYRYGTLLDAFWKTYEPPLISDRAFVIVERRCHPNLWFILRNIAYFGRGWAIYLFCSKQNYDYCAAILGKNLKNVHLKILYTELADSKVGVSDYNNTLKSKAFWEQIDSENLCIFQMDCYLRKPIPEELLEYDYVAPPWIWNTKLPGGSGLSLRKRSVMIDICEKKPPNDEGEDVFVALGVCEFGYNYLHSSESKKYFVESYMSDDPVAVHQWWTYAYYYNFKDTGIPKNVIETYLTLDVNLFRSH